MASTIQIRIDDELKAKSDSLFKELGTDTTTAIRMFLTQAVACNGFPFMIVKRNADPFAAMTEEELLQRLEAARGHAELGLVHDAGESLYGLRKKYGL